MAQKEEIQIKIDAAVDSADAAKSLGQLRRALLEIQELQAELGETSGANFDKLSAASARTSEQLAQTRDAIGDIADKTRTLEGTPVERLTNSFGLLKESIFTLDFEKAQIGAEGLLNTFTPVVDGKLVTGFAGIGGALSNVTGAVKNMGSTFLTLGKQLLTNPIFLLATAITLIVIGIIKLLDSLGLLKPMMDAIAAAIGFVVDAFEALTDWLGLTTNAQEEQLESAKKAGEEQRKQIDATAKAQQDYAKLTEGMTEDEIAAFQKAAGIKEDLTRNQFDIEAERLALTNETLQAEIAAAEELMAAGGELTEEQQKDLEQRRNDYAANAEQIKLIEAQKQKAIQDFNKQTNKTLEEWQLKNITDATERSKKTLEIQKAEEIRKIDVQIASGKKLGQDVSKLQEAKLEIDKYFASETKKIDADVAQKKKEESQKEYDAYKGNIGKKLKELETAQSVEVLKTQENTQARVDAEKKAIDTIIAFEEKNRKALGISTKDLEKLKLESIEKKKKLDDDYQKFLDDKAKQELEIENRKNLALAELDVIRATDKKSKVEAETALLDAQYKVDLSNAELTAEEKKKIDAEYAANKKALENDFNTFKAEQDSIIAQTEASKAAFDLENSQLTTDAKISKMTEATDLQLAALEAQKAAELSNTELTAAEKDAIEENYRQQKVTAETALTDKIKALKQAELQATVDTAQKGLQAGQALADAVFAVKKRNLKKGSEEELKAAKQQFAVNKALQLGLAVIDGFKAVTSSLSQSPVAFGPVPNPAGIASLAFAIATSAANIVKIAASKFEGGATTPSAPSPSMGGGGGGEGGGGAAPSSFTPSTFFGLGQAPGSTPGGEPKPQRVYVTETDITSTQNRVAVIENRAVIGG
jgi:hypothetical protein